MTDTNKPLNCPFCGGEAEIVQFASNGLEIKCKKCRMGVKSKVIRKTLAWCEDKLIESWNTRTPDKEVMELVELSSRACQSLMKLSTDITDGVPLALQDSSVLSEAGRLIGKLTDVLSRLPEKYKRS